LEWAVRTTEKERALEIDPATLGTLELDGMWLPYIDMYDADFIPAQFRMVNEDYAFVSSILIKGHSATLPQQIRALRADGKKPVIVERNDRYYVYVTPP
jgi:hypothetical protein